MSLHGKDSSVNTIAFIGTFFRNVKDDDDPDDADVEPHIVVVPLAECTRSWSWRCTKLFATRSYGTEVPVSMLSSSTSAVFEALVVLVAAFADELVANDDFFLLRRVR